MCSEWRPPPASPPLICSCCCEAYVTQWGWSSAISNGTRSAWLRAAPAPSAGSFQTLTRPHFPPHRAFALVHSLSPAVVDTSGTHTPTGVQILTGSPLLCPHSLCVPPPPSSPTVPASLFSISVSSFPPLLHSLRSFNFSGSTYK